LIAAIAHRYEIGRYWFIFGAEKSSGKDYEIFE
jgi:hypothetical protein